MGNRQPTCHGNTEGIVLDIIFAPANGCLGDLTSCASSFPAKKLRPLLCSWTSVMPEFWAEGALQPALRRILFLRGGVGRRLCELCSLPLGLKVFPGGRWLSQDGNTEKAHGIFFQRLPTGVSRIHLLLFIGLKLSQKMSSELGTVV